MMGKNAQRGSKAEEENLQEDGRKREDQISEDSNSHSGGDFNEENKESDDPVNSDVVNKLGTGEEEVKTNKKPGPYDKLNEDLDGMNKFEKVSSPSKRKSTAASDVAKSTSSSVPKIIFFLIIIILVCLSIWLFNLSSLNYREPEDFKSKLLKEVKPQFRNQYKLYWNMIKNGGVRHLEKVHEMNKEKEEKLTPQSYLIAGYKGSIKTVDCFIKKLVYSFTIDKFDESKQVIDSAKLVEKNIDIGELVDILNKMLDGPNKLVVIRDIDKLPYKTAKLFMSYADEHNEVASFPQSLLFLTTELPFSFDPERTRINDERLAADHFKNKVWAGTDKYLKDPLWSRVGDGLMLIKSEESDPCSKQNEDL